MTRPHLKHLVDHVKETLSTDLIGKFWGRRILAAAESGEFTKDDCHRAGKWPTCACGDSYHRYEFHRDKLQQGYKGLFDCGGAPEDKRLVELGMAFYCHVVAHNVWDAATKMRAIEDRARELAKS